MDFSPGSRRFPRDRGWLTRFLQVPGVPRPWIGSVSWVSPSRPPSGRSCGNFLSVAAPGEVLGVESWEWRALGIPCCPIPGRGFWDELPAHAGNRTEGVGAGALELRSRDSGWVWGLARGKDLVEVILGPGIPRQLLRRIPSPGTGIRGCRQPGIPGYPTWEWAPTEQDTDWDPPTFPGVLGIPERLLPLENRAWVGWESLRDGMG